MSSAPRLQNFIGGRWQDGMAGETIAVLDPATGEHLADVPLSDAAAIDAAVAAAAAAFPGWRATPPVQRARVLFRLKALLEEHLEEIAVSVSREHGKTLADARGEVRRGIENVEHACGIPSLMMGTTLEDVAAGIDCETVRQPLGVFAAVTPYNFPVMVPMWFWPYAVATGNTFVLKPSEQDPVSHQLVVRLCERAGLPAGVLNVVHGDRRSVDALLANADVKGISFVGSSQVAAGLYGRAAAAGKRVQALGGAKNHMLVLPDADMELVTEACMGSLFGGAGQRCLAGSIVVGVGGAGAAVRERLLEGARALRLGRGLDEGVDMGPLISARHRRRVREFVDAGEAGGAHLLLDGREASVRDHPRGQWFGPTLFEPADPDTALGRDEIFGPVAGIAQVDTLEQAVALMHRNPYGNATSIFTRSGAAAREFRYRAGISMIGVNIGVAAPMAFFPFGGSRGSFYGDLKAQGRDAIDFYTDKRVVISRWS